MNAATQDDIERGRWLFAQSCDFVAGADSVAALPPISVGEIAFAGRSNVGKSSLINALTGRRTLARTSHTPGRTQQLNFFRLADQVQLVDMPGYGYAAVGRSKTEGWTQLIRSYLRGRSSLLRVYLLVDGRHGLKPVDHETMDAFDESATSYAVVLTKTDDVKPEVFERNRMATLEGLQRHPAAFPDVFATSSAKNLGIAELRADVVRLLRERGDLNVGTRPFQA